MQAATAELNLEPRDIYDIEGRYASAMERLNNDRKLSARNKELILDFVRDLKIQGVSKALT